MTETGLGADGPSCSLDREMYLPTTILQLERGPFVRAKHSVVLQYLQRSSLSWKPELKSDLKAYKIHHTSQY